MSPLNRGSLLSPRMPPISVRPPPRFGRLSMPGVLPRMPPPPYSVGAIFGPMRPRMLPLRLGNIRPGGPPSLFSTRNVGPTPLMLPMMGPRGIGSRGPLVRSGPRRMLPPQVLPHMRPRFPSNSTSNKKIINNSKKVGKSEELELKKPWMSDEIRSEIQKKNKLYAKAKKNKNAKEWEEFKDLRNKVTRMIRDAKNEYLAKNPELVALYQNELEYLDERDENNGATEDEENFFYCETCERDFFCEKLFNDHNQTHIVCGIDECTFTAHPKLIEKHIGMQHRSGIYHKITNVSTPEEITKWISERKRKYPTKFCIERKKAEASEKQQRGEVIKKQKLNIIPRQIKHIEMKKHNAKKLHSFQHKITIRDQDVMNLYKGLCPFMGTGYFDTEIQCDEKTETNLTDNDKVHVGSSRIPDDEDNKEEHLSDLTFVSRFKSINSLVADYTSDTDNDGPDEIPMNKIKTKIELLNMLPDQNTSLVSNTTTKKSIKIKLKNINSSTKKNNESLKNILKSVNIRKSKKSSIFMRKDDEKTQQLLLQRLLSGSIVHERNFICQCIKYIDNNNFFMYTRQLVNDSRPMCSSYVIM